VARAVWRPFTIEGVSPHDTDERLASRLVAKVGVVSSNLIARSNYFNDLDKGWVLTRPFCC
jgi:hypothetical protein